MAVEDCCLAVRMRVPQPDLAIASAGQEPLAIRTEIDADDTTLMSLKFGNRNMRGNIPQPYAAVRTASGQQTAIAANCQAFHPFVIGERDCILRSERIPNLSGRVGTGRRQMPPVRTERYAG